MPRPASAKSGGNSRRSPPRGAAPACAIGGRARAGIQIDPFAPWARSQRAPERRSPRVAESRVSAARRGQRGYERDAIWRAKKREVVMIGVIVWLDELVGYPDESSTYTPRVPYTCPEGSAAPPRADAANRTVPCW